MGGQEVDVTESVTGSRCEAVSGGQEVGVAESKCDRK